MADVTPSPGPISWPVAIYDEGEYMETVTVTSVEWTAGGERRFWTADGRQFAPRAHGLGMVEVVDAGDAGAGE